MNETRCLLDFPYRFDSLVLFVLVQILKALVLFAVQDYFVVDPGLASSFVLGEAFAEKIAGLVLVVVAMVL